MFGLRRLASTCFSTAFATYFPAAVRERVFATGPTAASQLALVLFVIGSGCFAFFNLRRFGWLGLGYFTVAYRCQL